MNTKPQKPPKEALLFAKMVREARGVIDEKQTYRMKLPDGRVLAFSGADLLRTGEAYAEMIEAADRGDEDAERRAFLKTLALD